MFKLHPWQIEAIKGLHKEFTPIDKRSPPLKTCLNCYNVHGTAKKKCECGYVFIEEDREEHEHNMFETTTVCSMERHYVCLTCGHTETEPMVLTIPRKDK